MSVDDQAPKTLLDYGTDAGGFKAKGMTLEEALAQVDARSTGDTEDDEKLKTLYRIVYKSDPLEDWEHDFLARIEREALEEEIALNGGTAN